MDDGGGGDHKCKGFSSFKGEKRDWSPKSSGDKSGEPRMVDMHLSSGWPVAPDIAAAAAIAGAGNWNACGD